MSHQSKSKTRIQVLAWKHWKSQNAMEFWHFYISLIPYKRGEGKSLGLLTTFILFIIVFHFALIQTVKGFGACSILSPLVLYVTWSPCLLPFPADNTCFDIDTLQSRSGLQSKKNGHENPSIPLSAASPRLVHTSQGLHTPVGIILYLTKLTVVTENRIWNDISAKGPFQVWRWDNSYDISSDHILYQRH